MSPRRKAEGTKLLTEVELELMGILWRLDGGTVADTLAQLPAGRKLAYTSVSTIFRILEQKGVLASRKEGRGHVYTPKLKKDEYEAQTLRHLVTKVFDDTPSSLVRRLLEDARLTPEELERIRATILEKKP